MGCTSSVVVPYDDSDGLAVSQNVVIERKLRADADKDRRVLKCLILGAGECGKSTLMKQMKILHGNGFQSSDERESFRALIQRNTVDSLLTLLTACHDLCIEFDHLLQQSQAQKARKFCHEFRDHASTAITGDTVALFETMWQSSAVQRALLRENEFTLLDSAAYFLSQCRRILSRDYEPTDSDILHSRLSTSGIIESVFQIDKLTFRMLDVGGQRGERKKWIHSFDSATALLYVASLSEYDQVLDEDRSRNRMHESLDLFEGINNLPWFRTIPIILFLNKADIFAKKVLRVDIGIFFPHYTGGCHYDNGLRFIQEEFLSRNHNPNKNIYCHVTDATNTENIAFVWRAAKHIILEESFGRSGMLM